MASTNIIMPRLSKLEKASATCIGQVEAADTKLVVTAAFKTELLSPQGNDRYKCGLV